MTGLRWTRRLGLLCVCLVCTAVAACTGQPPAPSPTSTPPLKRTVAPTKARSHRPSTSAAADRIRDLTPKPVAARPLAGRPFTLTARTGIVVTDSRARAVATYLARLLRPATGYPMPITDRTPHAGDIVLRLGAAVALSGHTGEGYQLTVHTNRVQVRAATDTGLFYAVQTLRQLLPIWIESHRRVGAAWTIPSVSITDYPRFGYRGVMLDVARSFLTVPEVERFIDAAAMFKIDYLHLHLTDDQAWRIAIDNPASNPAGIDYRALTTVGARGGADDLPDGTPRGTGPARRGYYTQADYRALVAYARARHITIVPEVDGPAHTNAALASIPQLNPDGRVKPMNITSSVGYSSLDADSPVTYQFLRTVWRQLAAMTPGPYLHIGGDEAHSTPHAAYLTYVRRVLPIVAGLGKAPIGWTEYTAARLPAGAVVQYWSGSLAPVLRQTRHGVRVLMSPANRTYLDQKYDPATPLGLNWACRRNCDALHYYAWNPVHGGLHETDVLGVEAPLWSETVRGLAQAEYLAFPRLVATAEIGWTPQRLRGWSGFAPRLATVGARLTVAGVNFHAGNDIGWTITLLTPQVPVPVNASLASLTAPGLTADQLHATVRIGKASAPVDARVRCAPTAGAIRALGVCTVRLPTDTPSPTQTFNATVTVSAPGRSTATGHLRISP